MPYTQAGVQSKCYLLAVSVISAGGNCNPINRRQNVYLFSLLSLFWKNKSRRMRSPCCLCVCVSSPINCWMPETIFVKLGMYIMAPEPIWTAFFINPSHQSVCLYVYPLSLLGDGSVRTLPRQRTQAAIEELLDMSFSMRSVSYQRTLGD
jgi:hypothetical protein